MRKRLLSILLILLVSLAVLLVGVFKVPMKEIPKPSEKTEEVVSTLDKETVYIWYSDDTLTNYLNSAAVAYNEKYQTRIMPVLQSPLEYLEAINEATVNDEGPDAYILPHSSLVKAYMAGLAQEITLSGEMFERSYIGQADNSVTCKDKRVGYPMFFETPVLLYNETYLTAMADTKNAQLDAEREAAQTVEEGESSDAADAAGDTAGDDAADAGDVSADAEEGEVDDPGYITAMDLIPTTIGNIEELAESYDAPEGVESFLKWDVSDVFFNYFFLGDAINVGGAAGWDTNQIDIYNEDAIKCITEYQKLNQFFSIDSSNSDYSQVVNEFMEGKIVFTLATSDVIATLENARAEGTFSFDYGVALIPDMNDEIDTRAMSVTNCMVINPFSEKTDIANDFAYFATCEFAGEMYAKSMKVPVAKNITYDYEAFNIYAMEYGYSAPLPKMMETSNLWVQLEAAFKDVWDGEDPNATLRHLAEKIMYQISGKVTTLDTIELPEEEDDTEYDAW